MDYDGKFTGPEIDARLEKAEQAPIGVVVKFSMEENEENADAWEKINSAFGGDTPIVPVLIGFGAINILYSAIKDSPSEIRFEYYANGMTRNFVLHKDGHTTQ